MLSQQNLFEEKKMTFQKKIVPSYMVLYVFNGTLRRGGVGHISLWDGASYYSYGKGNGEPWIEKNFSLAKSNARAMLDYKIWKYGPYKKIILPFNHYLSENYESVRSNINTNWNSNAYSIKNRNCAHMVQDYLVQAKYTIPIPDCSQFPLYPSEVANNAINIGKTVVEKILNEITMDSVTTAYQMRLYNDFLVLLNSILTIPPFLTEPHLKELHDAMQGERSNQEKFCKVFAIIARHHYDNTLFAHETNECDKFYENMFVEALQACSHRPKFENEPQVYKTGRLRQPIAIARAIIGVVLGTVVAVIVFVPALFFVFYKTCVSQSPPKKDMPSTGSSPDSDSKVAYKKLGGDSTRNINDSIKDSILSPVVTDDTYVQLPNEHKQLSNKRDNVTPDHHSKCRIS